MKLSQSCSPDHLFLTLIEGVHAIHLPGHIHNDVKPNNTMVEVRGLRLIIALEKHAHFTKENFTNYHKVKKQKIFRKVSSFVTWNW